MTDQPFSLLRNLAKAEPEDAQRTDGKMAFTDALQTMGIDSVFDILRRAKPAFVRELSSLSDADGDLAYENARCYATQIVRLYRNQLISSGRKQVLTRRTGIRSLVDIGPSFPNLFEENWDTFCKVGAIEAKDSPVAYLASLYRFAKEQLEDSTSEPSRIALDLRRPDLSTLLIDQESTFTPIPTLQIVNNVLSASIREYVDKEGNPDKNKSIYQLVAEKQHPFQFPYNFHHQQITLGLSGKKPELGELSYRVSLETPCSAPGSNEYGRVQQPSDIAQKMMNGLSSEQHLIATEVGPRRSEEDGSDFSAVMTPSALWTSPHLTIAPNDTSFSIRPQGYVKEVFPPASAPSETIISGTQNITMQFKNDSNSTVDALISSHQKFSPDAAYDKYQIHSLAPPTATTRELCLLYPANGGLPHDGLWYHTTLELALYRNTNKGWIDNISVKIYACGDTTPEFRPSPGEYDPEQLRTFFQKKYAIDYVADQANPLDSLKVFMEKTGLTAKEVESLLAIRNDAPYPSPNVTSAGVNTTDPLNAPSDSRVTSGANYGATYVNGPSSSSPMGIDTVVVNNKPVSRLTNTTVDRFDRLQRMIRLQRWMGISFAELDTLVSGLIRSEGAANPTQTLSTNTLRGLGVFRYLNKRYALEAEEFSACVYRLAAFASGGRLPMFDRVFNSPMLFDSPLKLDATQFYLTGTTANDVRTVAQLSAGLQLQPTEDSLWPLAIDAREFLDADLKRNLSIVSAIYRQARIASMFGLAAQDSRALIDLLGGEAYRRKVVTGTLTPRPEGPAFATNAEPDILDILMQMDWAVTWLKETGRDVGALRRQLGIDTTQSEAGQDILAPLNQLAKDAREAALTESQLANLNLPDDSNGSPIAWWSAVLSPLIDANGLVKSPTLRMADDVSADLAALIEPQLADIVLSDEIKAQASAKLLDFVLKGYLTQHRLVEGLLQSVASLPLNRCEGVVRWAGSSVDQFLGQVVVATAEAELELPLSPAAKTVIDTLTTFIRHAEVSLQLGLSAQALRTFLVNPTWLHSAFVTPLTLSLSSLFLLDRYGQWRDTAGQSEGEILGYFSLANTQPPPTEHNRVCATALATLTGWSATEIESAAQLFPASKKFATSMQQIDWIRRMQSTSQQTALSAKSMLQATDLTHQSTSAQWQAVGEAVMAASS